MKFYLPPKLFFFTLSFMLLCSVGFGATYTVTNTNDSGPGSLRQAILDANANPGADIINITANGVVSMPINTQMTITEEVVINGNPNYALATPSGNMLIVSADNVTLDGMIFEDDTFFYTNVNGITSNGYNQLVVRNCVFKLLRHGVSVLNGEDFLIHGNTFEGTGSNGACLTAGNITESTTTNRSLDFYDNSFIGGLDGISLSNVENITFNATGTSDIVLDVADGYRSLTGILLEVSNMDNLVIDGFDLGFEDGSNTSFGRCFIANNCDNLTFQNNSSNNRRDGFYFTHCDTVLIHNNTITRTDPNGGTPSTEGISVAFGSNATITDNSLTAMGQQTGRYAMVLNDISQDTNGDRVDVRGNTFSACADAISISLMDNIEIDETLTGTTEIHLPNTDGRKSCIGINLNLFSCDNVTLENFDLGYDDPSQNTFGRALNVQHCDNLIVQNNTTNNRKDNFYFSFCDTLLVQNNTITRTGTHGGQPATEGISVTNGSNVSILNNSLTSIGQSINRFAIILNEIGFDVNNNRLDVQGNTFNSCGNAVSINNMDDLEIDETYVPGVTEIHLPNTDGRLSCHGINLRLFNNRNLIIENFDLGFTTAGNPLGQALDANNCDNMVFQNNTSDNRLESFYFTSCDTLSVDNNSADHSSGSGVTRSGINVTGGSNAIITNNIITKQGQQFGHYAVNLDNIQFDGNSDRIDYHSNTFSNCTDGIRFANMSDLEVHETSSGTTEIHLPDTDGRQGCTGTNVHFLLCDNLVFDGFDLSFTGAATFQGIGLNANSCDNLSITNNNVDNRNQGLYIVNCLVSTINDNTISNINGRSLTVENGSNATVKNNSFTNTGLINEFSASLNLIHVTDDGSSRLDVTGNSFNGGNYGFYIQGMNNLNVSETYVSGTTEIHMPSNTGMNTLQSRVYFNDCDDLSLSNFNFVKDGAQSVGYGIRVNNSVNVTLDNFIVSKYNTASVFLNNTDLSIQNSEFSTGIGGMHFDGTQYGLTLTNNILDGFNGTGENNGAIRINAVGTSGVTSDFLSMSGNKFKNNSNGLIVKNTDNMTVSDGSVPGTHISIVPSDSIYTSFSPLQFLFGDNLSVENIAIKEKPGVYRTGNGIYLYRSTNSSFNNVSVSGRNVGLRIIEEDGITISNCLLEDNLHGINAKGLNNLNILNITANNNNFSCNGTGIYADNNAVIDAANNYWGASDGSTSDSGSGDTYFESTVSSNEGFVNNTTTFLTSENSSSPIGGRKIFNASTAQLTDEQTAISTADSTDYGMVDIGMMKTRQFRIVNTSTDTLFITSITSSNGQFTIANAPAFVLCGDSTAFDVIYTPTNENMETSTIDILADDCYGTDFEFNVAGEGFQPCDITINSVTPTNETCDGADDGVLTVNASCVSCTNGASDIRYSIDGSDFSNTTGIFTGLADGTYTVTIRDVNDEPCTDTSTGHVIAAGTGACCDIAITSATPTDENCPGVDDGEIDVVATCTSCTSIEYSIDDFATMNTTGDFTGLADGTYTVKVRDSGDNSCAAEMMNVVVGAGSDTEDPFFEDPTEVLLYVNDFEVPNISITPNFCLPSHISSDLINDVYGTPENLFDQVATVEPVFIEYSTAPWEYLDPLDIGGNYSIGMLSNLENDMLSLSFDKQGLDFLNVRMDIAPIGLALCLTSNPTTPTFRLTVYDDPDGIFDISNITETVLDFADVTGIAPDPSNPKYNMQWKEVLAGLDVSGSTNNNIALVWDLLGTSGYATFDNLEISASNSSISSNLPDDISIECLGNLPAVPTVVAFDNCDNDVTVTYSQNPASPTGNDQTITRTWTATDDVNNMAIGTQIITVDDQAAPLASCTDITVNLVGENNYTLTQAEINMIGAGSTDNCGTPTYSISAGQTTYNCADVGSSYTVTLTADDGNGNTNTCTAMVTVEDTNSFCCDISITSTTPTDENCPGADDGQIDVVATCTTCTSIEYSIDDFATMNTTGDFTDLADGTYTVKIRDSGDISCVAEMMNVVVAAGVDTEDPTFGFTDTTTIQLYLEDFESPIVTPVSQTNPISPTGFYDIDASPVATLFGANYSQTFTVETVLFNGTDNQYSDPSGTGGDYSLGIWNGQDDLFGISFDIQNKAFINVEFDAAGIELFSADPGANSNGTWNFTELATPEFQITIYDDPNQNFDINNLPAFTVLAQDNLTGALPSSGAFTTIWANLITGLDVSGSTNGNVVLVFNLTSATNSYAALDNIDIQASDISVTGEPPVDIALQCLSELPAVPEVDGVDNCDMDVDVTYVQNPASPTGNDQTITRTWTLMDDAANTAMHVQTITIDDTEAPVVVCPTNTVTVILDANGNGTLAANSLGDGSSTDNCGTVTETNPMMSFTCANLGANTVVLTADDGNGNTDTENCTVMVVDQMAPTFDCSGVNTYNLGINATCDSVYVPNLEFENFLESDNCDGTPTFSQSPMAGSLAAGSVGGSLTVTVTFTDASGNSDNCDILFPIADLTSPTISVQDVTVSAVNGVGTITPAMVNDGSSDNCTDAGNLALSLSESTFNCDDAADCYQVTTAAGMKDVTGFQDGAGLVASFNRPRVLEFDANGDLIILAQHNHAVRKMTPAGVVTTIAGNGSSGYQDGTGSGAQFANPSGLAIDNNGDYFVSDWLNSVIRKVTPAGVVTTFVGTAGVFGSADGTGTAAQFSGLRGMDFDSNGDLFVADFGNHNIRKITPAGVVTTFAGQTGVSGHQDGTGAGAIFNAPMDLVIDENDNIYMIEFSGSTIRKITPAGVVTTLAGNPGVFGFMDGNGANAAFAAPSGIAYANEVLYIADQSNQSIRSVSLTGDVKTISGKKGVSDSVDGGSDASFNAPFGIAVDAGSGEIYVGDLIGHVVRKLEVVPDCFSTLLTVTDESGNESQGLSHITLTDCCDIEVASVTPTDEGCPDADDGSITIDANCASCDCSCDYTPVAGTWNGTIDQTGFSSYSASLVISCGATNTSSYPDFPCNAELVFNSKVGNTFIFDENVTSGAGCVNGIVHLTPNGADLLYEWYSTDNSSYASGIITGTPDACLEYSIDGTNWQAENVFSDLSDGTYTAHVRDVNDNTCTDSNTGYVINTGMDTEDPVAICPANQVIIMLDANGNGSLAANSLGDGSSTDNCGTVTETNPAMSYTCADLGENMVTLTADDGYSNTHSVVCTVMVVDEIDPTITCPDDIEMFATAGTCIVDGGTVDLGTVTSDDNCGAPTVSNDFGASRGQGTHTITHTAEDASGNSVTCEQTVTIFKPQEIPDNGIDDDCDGDTDETPLINLIPLEAGATTGSCVSNTDCCTDTYCYGLEYTPDYTGTLKTYTTGFIVDCAAGNNVVVYNESCVMTDNSNEITDCAGAGGTLYNSSGFSGTLAITEGSPVILHQICFDVPANESVTSVVDEVTGLTMSIELSPETTITENPVFQDLTVDGNTPPVMTTGSIDMCYANEAAAIADALAATSAMDDCTAANDIVITAAALESCSTFIRVTAADACGLESTFDYPTTIDGDMPLISGALDASTVEGCAANEAPAPLSSVMDLEALPGTLSISDACTPDMDLTVTSSESSSGTCPIVVTRVYTIEDACGNTETFTHILNVDDTTPPQVIGQPTDSNLEGCSSADAPVAATDVAGIELLLGGVQINDVCSDANLTVTSEDIVVNTCPIEITRIYTITDLCGNPSNVVHKIFINDTTMPVLASGTIDACYANEMDAADAAIAATTFTDACATSLSYTSAVSGSCPTVITVSGADDCGNVGTTTYTVQINDGNGPAEVGGPVETESTIQTALDAIIPQAPVFEDNCGNTLTPSVAMQGGTYQEGDCIGTITYSYEYADCAGTITIWTYTYNVDCQGLNVKIFLEGGYDVDGDSLTLKYNQEHLLPGQDKDLSTDFSVLIAADHTPFGQPYQEAPWNYVGNLGMNYGESSSPDAPAMVIPYPEHVADWILVSVRENGNQPADQIWMCAGWLHKTGEITFPEACPDVLNIDENNEYFVVVEHRNHLPVLDTATISMDGTYLEMDFTTQNSWAPIFRFGQLELAPGTFGMYGGNGDQIVNRQSINSADNTLWAQDQNKIGYNLGDFIINLSVNSADESLWKINQNKSTGIKF